MMKPKAIDLFCGCGGLTSGLKQAGFKVIAGIDCEPLAIETYKLNHGNTRVFEQDIKSITGNFLKTELEI